jgi:curved DNA-binding protein CbpA
MRPELAILELIPPISMADLKIAYRRAAAKHHPDLGGTHEGMILVNDAYEQLKWEVERGQHQQKVKQSPTPPQPPSGGSRDIWEVKIDDLIGCQVKKGFKKAWVAFQLLESELEPPLEAWQYLAARLEYKEGWAYYKSREWKPIGEREVVE